MSWSTKTEQQNARVCRFRASSSAFKIKRIKAGDRNQELLGGNEFYANPPNLAANDPAVPRLSGICELSESRGEFRSITGSVRDGGTSEPFRLWAMQRPPSYRPGENGTFKRNWHRHYSPMRHGSWSTFEDREFFSGFHREHSIASLSFLMRKLGSCRYRALARKSALFQEPESTRFFEKI